MSRTYQAFLAERRSVIGGGQNSDRDGQESDVEKIRRFESGGSESLPLRHVSITCSWSNRPANQL